MSADAPGISIIVPAYNAGRYLADCLESIIRQTFSDWEMIIADDGSSDMTFELSDKFASQDPRIRVIHLKRQGVSAARNSCLEKARGRYLAFVDADDLLEPDYLKDLFRKAEQSGADITQCSFFYERNGEKIPEANGVDGIFEDSGSIMRAYFNGMHGDIRDGVWAKLFRREVFSDIRFDTGLSIYEDSYYIYQCLKKAGKVMCFSTPLYRYVQHSDSTTHTRIYERYEDFFSMFEKQKEDLASDDLLRKRISNREAETALWLIRKMVDYGNTPAFWDLRKRILRIASDVIFFTCPFVIKLKTVGVMAVPHLYYALLKGRKEQEYEKV